jgi:hypothetical protein
MFDAAALQEDFHNKRHHAGYKKARHPLNHQQLSLEPLNVTAFGELAVHCLVNCRAKRLGLSAR